jgi:hypothetical protein
MVFGHLCKGEYNYSVVFKHLTAGLCLMRANPLIGTCDLLSLWPPVSAAA